MKKFTVEVGIFNDELVKIANYQIHGTDKIPVRDFWNPPKKKILNAFKRTVEKELAPALITKDYAKVYSILDKVGLEATSKIRQSISAFAFPPNAESTIRKKGFNDPLIDTGDMLFSVEWKVKKSS